MTSEAMASRAVWMAFEIETKMVGLTKWAEQAGRIVEPNGVDK